MEAARGHVICWLKLGTVAGWSGFTQHLMKHGRAAPQTAHMHTHAQVTLDYSCTPAEGNESETLG